MLTSIIALTVFSQIDRGKVWEVGPGKQFARIEDAVDLAKSGDVISVFPSPDGYVKTAVRVRTPLLTIRGVGQKPVEVKGDGFDYSGSGSVPRAIFQIDPSGTGSKIENLNLSGSHNLSFNGAGVRIQGANDVMVSDCIIHDNDMGIMSNGKAGDAKAGSNQRIEYCLIERNGNMKDPGYNHNLYLGGTSATLLHCEIRNSTTGHNVKSRAHYIEIIGCFIHDAVNREIDLPEAWDTTRPNSNAVLIGNRIVKDPQCLGNRGVIHFGQEKGTRVGNIFLFLNTIVTPFSSPMLSITGRTDKVIADRNIFLNSEQSTVQLWDWVGTSPKIFATSNHLSPGYGSLGGTNSTATKRTDLLGLVLPTYRRSAATATQELPTFTWLDGDEMLISMTPDFEPSAEVGPRLRH